MSFLKRKHGSRNQRGKVFPVREDPHKEAQRRLLSRRMTGNIQHDVGKERYLETIVRESKTHDLNTVIRKLTSDALALTRELRATHREKEKALKVLTVEGTKLLALQEALEALSKVKESGRTRIGDSEMKVMMRKIMHHHNVTL